MNTMKSVVKANIRIQVQMLFNYMFGDSFCVIKLLFDIFLSSLI